MERNIFISWASFAVIIAAIIILGLIVALYFIPILKIAPWVGWGGIFLGMLIGIIGFSRIYPFILIIKEEIISIPMIKHKC